jgi:hypothetical protein
MAIIDNIHPCIYKNSMPPDISWRSSNIALSLIKGSPWAYEREWRFVKKTIRPKMRIVGSLAHQIYNAVHSDPELSRTEHEEWGKINAKLMQRLEKTYHEERVVKIKPSRIYLGLNFDHNYVNELTKQICNSVRETAERASLPVYRMDVRPRSFDLFAADVVDNTGWTWPLGLIAYING